MRYFAAGRQVADRAVRAASHSDGGTGEE